jgi:hypothetical protein
MQSNFRSISVITLLTFFIAVNCHGQELNAAPKNFVGTFAGIEWNTISGLVGVSYERAVYVVSKAQFGLKGTYIFKYEYGNMQLLNGSCCENTSGGIVLATGTLYTSKENKYKGFFLHGGLGGSMLQHELEGIVKETKVRAALEGGFGLQFKLGTTMAIRWTNSVLFHGNKGGITLTQLSLAF